MANLKRAWIHYRSACPRCSNRRLCCLVTNARVLVHLAVEQARAERSN